MNPKAFYGIDQKKKDNYETLKKEYDETKMHMSNIQEMEISNEAKEMPLKELQQKIDEIKCRMHDYIDTL